MAQYSGEYIRITPAARRHKVGSSRIRHVIAYPVAIFEIEPPQEGQDVRTLFLGADKSGRALEVMAVPNPRGGLLVVHAMDLRDKYREAYESAVRLSAEEGDAP